MKKRSLKQYGILVGIMLVIALMFTGCTGGGNDGNDGDKGKTDVTSSSPNQSDGNAQGDEKTYAIKVGEEVLSKESLAFLMTLQAQNYLDSGIQSLDQEFGGKPFRELIKMSTVDQYTKVLAMVAAMKKESVNFSEEEIQKRVDEFKTHISTEAMKRFTEMGLTDEILKEQHRIAAYESEFVKRYRTLFKDSAQYKNLAETEIVQVKARHILLETEEEAKKVLELVKKGEKTFSELASEFTKDPSGVNSGGDLGYFGKGMMVPDFESAAFALEKGAVSDVVPSPFGFHIILCEDRRTVIQMIKDGVDPEIIKYTENMLVEAYAGEVIKQQVEILLKDFSVDVDADFIEAFEFPNVKKLN